MTPLSEKFLDSLASAAVREGLADAVFTRLSTPIGRLLVVQGAEGIVRIGFEEEPEDRLICLFLVSSFLDSQFPPPINLRHGSSLFHLRTLKFRYYIVQPHRPHQVLERLDGF